MPLQGVRVLDLTRLLPGPFATMILAGLGAEVVKVEDPHDGDLLRAVPPQVDGTSVMFRALNRGKRSVRLDLRSERGRELFLTMVERAHVVVEGFRPGVLDRLGLGVAALHARNPRVVVCSISGYGADGPDRLRAGHDLDYLARSGVLATSGAAGETPPVPGVQMADMGGGGFGAVIAILAALRVAERDGVGTHCDVSMTDAMLSWMAPHLAAARAGAPAAPGAMLLNGAHPCYRVYRCADGWLAVAALEPRFWSNLCARLGVEDLGEHAFATGSDGERAVARIESVLLTATRAEWRRRLDGADVCVEPVLSPDEVLSDPQVRHRARGRDSWFPFQLEGRAGAPAGEAPACGGDSRSILAEVGVGDTEFDALLAQGVTG